MTWVKRLWLVVVVLGAVMAVPLAPAWSCAPIE